MAPAPLASDAYPPALLQGFARAMFVAAGASEHNATIVAEHLTTASLCGVDTHGLIHVPGYLDAIAEGRLDPRANPEIERKTDVSVRVRGNWGFGHVTALRATELGVERALAGGVAVTAIVECGHIGRVGHYAELAAEAGVVAMLYAGGYGYETPAAVAFGGRQPVLHTNPIAFAFPGGRLPGPAFDFATTSVAGMKVAEARRNGRPVAAGSIVDRDGAPTEDPEDFFNGGALLPFGGHKGYALMVQAEWLGRIATGADAFAAGSPAEPVMRHQGTMGIFVRADLFASAADVAARSDEMAGRISGSAPAPGVAAVQLPGDPERAARAARSASGIPMDSATLDALIARARALGVDVPAELLEG